MKNTKEYVKEYYHRPEVIKHRREWFREYFKKPEVKAYYNEWIGRYHKGKGKAKWNNYMKNYQRKHRALMKLNLLLQKLDTWTTIQDPNYAKE